MSEQNAEDMDPEVILQLYEFKEKALQAIVSHYSKIFDKVFKKLIESLNEKPEEVVKFHKIKDKHLIQFKETIDKRLDQQMESFYNNSEVMSKLHYLSNNSTNDELIEVTKAVQPFKQQFVNQLQDLEEKVSKDYELREEESKEVVHQFNKAFKAYDECRKTLQKKVHSILNELESIESEDKIAKFLL